LRANPRLKVARQALNEDVVSLDHAESESPHQHTPVPAI
jgi:hypothetical protein